MSITYTREYIEGLVNQNDYLQEQLDDVVSQMNDVGWETIAGLTGLEDQGLKLKTLKEASRILRDMTETNPLFRRGNQLRHSYCYARGVNYSNLKTQSKTAMQNPYNRDACFSNQAYEMGMKARFTDGNRFILKNNKTKQLIAVPLEQISDALTDDDDKSRIKYIKRSWDANGKAKTAWYPTNQLRQSSEKIATDIQEINGKHKVDKDYTMFHKAYNRPVGQTWGVPDSLAAMLWAKAYSAYLKDNATLVKAYSRIAMSVSSTTSAGAANVSARIAANTGIGGSVVKGRETEVSVMPPQGSNVDFNNGRPLAAVVASTFGVSIVALLSDPGTGGSYGVAETLDPPTLLMAQNLQADEKEFYEDILRSFANPDATVSFPEIDTDPTYRSIQSIAQLASQGIISRREAREIAIHKLDVQNPDKGLPKPDPFNAAGMAQNNAAPSDPIPRQGNSGSVGTGIGSNHDAQQNGEYDN